MSISAYQTDWVDQFRRTAAALRSSLGDAALRIDHIGSTAVPGIHAKPVIDIQVTLVRLEASADMVGPMAAMGFIHRPDILADRPPPWEDPDPAMWQKAYFRTPNPPLSEVTPAQLRTHVHVREAGRRNQRYPLLFRDYLKANPRARDAYGLFKIRAAEAVGHLSAAGGAGPYLDLKDPMLDLIADGAEGWAHVSGWRPGPSDA